MTAERKASAPPSISIITATYNSEKTIRDALESVASQNYPNVEHIIQDGASTDETLKVIEAFGLDRPKLASEADGGIYDALNRSIARASGEVIGLLHSDDTFASPEVLNWVAEVFSRNPALDAVYGDLEYVSAKDPNRIIRYWKSGDFNLRKLRNGWMPPHPTLFLRRRVFEQYGDYNTGMRIAADYDAILRWLNVHRIKIHYLRQTLVKMRLGGASNRSISAIIKKSTEDLQAIRRNKAGGVLTLVLKNLRKLGQFKF